MITNDLQIDVENERVTPDLWSTRSGVVSLLDMLKFAANDFVWIMHEVLVFVFEPRLIIVDRVRVMAALQISEQLCDKLTLTSARNQHVRIRKAISSYSDQISPPEFKALMEELLRRLQEDMAEKNFAMIPSDKFKYMNPLWLIAEPLANAFPMSEQELINAGRCLAFSQEIACVFHSMRALELGLSALAAKLGVVTKKPDWQNIINEIEAEIKKINGPHAGQDWKQKEKFYSEAATNFRYFKNAWRNHVMHVRDKYTERESKDIMEHVISFLNVLAEGGISE